MSGTTHAVSGVSGSSRRPVPGRAGDDVAAGELPATFLPGLGMTGVSLRCRGQRAPRPPGRSAGAARRRDAGPAAAGAVGEPTGVAALSGGRRRRRPRRPAARHRRQRPPDPRPARRPARMAHRCDVRPAAAGPASGAAIDVDAPAFPFPHRIELSVAARDRQLTVDTTVVPTGRRAGAGGVRLASVPAPAGHPAQPLAPAAAVARTHLALDALGSAHREPSRPSRGEADPIGRRTFDDLYRLGRDRRLAWWPTTSPITMRAGTRLPVRPGVGAAGSPVRRPRADDGPPPTASSTARRRSSNRATRSRRRSP